MKKTIIQNITFVIVFILASSILHIKDFNKLPASTHAWAQSDHYALALGFHNDGFDFFHPTTFALDVQFPATKKVENPIGISAVDFPIFHYTVAILMKSMGTTAPWVYRITMLLLSFLALFSVFRTLATIKNTATAIIFVSFIMFQPIYCFYQDGFHVSAAAFNVFLIALSFGMRYFHFHKQRDFIFIVLLLTLASLMRFTHIISLLALGGSYFLVSINKKSLQRQLYFITAGIMVVLAYFIYNKVLTANYGSLFLGHPIPANSLAQATSYFKNILSTYSRGFLPFVHLTMLFLIITAFLKYKKEDLRPILDKPWLLWGLVSLFGTLSFSGLMMWGISAHDYYSMDTWLPFFSIAISYLLFNIKVENIHKETFLVATTLFAIASFSVALEVQLKKYREDATLSKTDVVIQDFKASSNWLDNSVPTDARTLIICSQGWNSPMIGWQRKAFRIHNINKETLGRLNTENYDYIVVHKASLSDESNDIINSYCTLINSNESVSIYQQQ